MSSISDAFDAPITFRGCGLDVTFPRLDIDDHAKWCAELHAQRKPFALKMIPGNAPPIERFKMQRSVEFAEPTLDDIAELLFTPAGVRSTLDKSLEKSGMDEATRKTTINRIPPASAQKLAMSVSGLYQKLPPPVPTAAASNGGASPLAQGSGSPGGATSTPATGDGRDSS